MKEVTVKASLPLPMDLDLRLEAQYEEGLQQVEANEVLKVLGPSPQRPEAILRIKTKMLPP